MAKSETLTLAGLAVERARLEADAAPLIAEAVASVGAQLDGLDLAAIEALRAALPGGDHRALQLAALAQVLSNVRGALAPVQDGVR